jgi:predicted TIM-barrel fold metal-dependent hydrolase
MSSPAYPPEDIFLSTFEPRSELITEEHVLTKPLFPVIEFHGHIFKEFNKESFFKELNKNHAEYFINLALRTVTKEDFVKLLDKTGNDKRILHFPGLNWEKTKTDDYKGMANDLEEIVKMGNVKGIKLWKDFGLKHRKKNGKLIRMDDPDLDPVWDVCEKYNLLVAMHTADPPAFFREVDRHNERLPELSRHSDWSFTGGDLPSFQDLLDQRDRLFKRKPRIRFIAQHFGELAHDLNQASRMLDTNPSVWVDMAQRIDELGRQPGASRAFIIKYQNRILYGTDGMPDYEKARVYWRFLETKDEYFDYHPLHKPKKGIWKIYGLGLPETVLRKIYYNNSVKLLGL